jgi:small subunit ribosomal protein S20
MPVTNSAIKKDKQDKKARLRNRGIRDEYKLASKKVKKYIESGDTKKAKEALSEAFSKLDKAAKRNVLHKNNASRRKSRLTALVSKEKVSEKPKKATPKK